MNLYDIEKRTMQELLQGYYRDDEGGYVCLDCGFTSPAPEEQEAHLNSRHRQEDEAAFISLLNIDSILGPLSYTEKNVYHAFYLNKSDREIEAELGINASTIRSYRHLLQKELSRCKAMLMICERLDLGKRRYKKKAEPDERLPGMDSNGNVIGFYTKERVHSISDPIYHASTILLVAQKDSRGEMRFLICTKSSKMITLTGTTGLFSKKWIDVEGGQCQESDSAFIELGKPLPDDIFLNCARRELLEEVYIKNHTLDESRLQYLYTDKGDRLLYPNGRNIEISGVYLLRIPDNIPKANILVRDEWTDSIGEVVKKKYPCELMTWNELEAAAQSDGGDMVLMDGLARVVERIKADGELKARMFKMLEEQGG